MHCSGCCEVDLYEPLHLPIQQENQLVVYCYVSYYYCALLFSLGMRDIYVGMYDIVARVRDIHRSGCTSSLSQTSRSMD